MVEVQIPKAMNKLGEPDQEEVMALSNITEVKG
jgi:hypothetical protein